MRADHIERVFGRSRLRMVTGEHVEVFREEAMPGERRRYTKRFLSSMGSDFRYWTEREWRMLARLVGHGIAPVPDVVQFDRGAVGRPALVQTYDAGITVDHWATLLPVERAGDALHHIFEDCAHWWALARHALMALHAIHALQVVHLDLKADNICIPHGPADFDPRAPGQVIHPQLGQIALIDFAFSLVSGEALEMALPIGHQADYEYQSPRLLQALEAGRRGNLLPTRQLDWRCDIFSLAAMLRRYLPLDDTAGAGGWNDRRIADALSFVRRLVDAHDRNTPAQRPHEELIGLTSRVLRERELSASLLRGWHLSREPDLLDHDSATPVTRIAWPVTPAHRGERPPVRASLRQVHPWLWAAAAVAFGALGAPWLQAHWPFDRGDEPVAAQAPAATTPTQETTVAQAPAAEALPAPPFDVITPPPPAPAAAASAAQPTAPAVVAAASPPAAPPIDKPVATPRSERTKPQSAVAASRAPVRVAAATPRAATKATSRAVAKPAPTPRKTWVASLPAPVARPTAKPAPPFAPAAGPVRGQTPAVPATPAPAVEPPVAVAAAPATPPQPMPQPTPAPVTRAVQVQAEPPPKPPPEDFGARASWLLAEQLPRVAQQAEQRVLRVLHVAAQSDSLANTSEIAEAASALHRGLDAPLAAGTANTGDAKSLAQAAETAFWSERNAAQALSLQTRAFGADAYDQVIAANLAFYFLKQRPVRAEQARQMALYALTLPDPRYPRGRIEDWTTLAVASALTGRERDARNAFFVTLALSDGVDRQCRNALAAVAFYGERLRGPSEAMLARIRTWGRSEESSFCRWPPSWWAGAR